MKIGHIRIDPENLSELHRQQWLSPDQDSAHFPTSCNPGLQRGLKLLASAVRERYITEIKPRYVFGVAELLDETSRALINETFDVEMVDIVVHSRVRPEVLQRLRTGLEAATWHEATVKIEIVDRLERSPGDKIRRITSKVPVNL